MAKLFQWLLVCSALFALIGCEKQSEKDAELIQNYLKNNNLDSVALSTPEGIYYVIEREGSGITPGVNNRVTVDYEGRLLDGTKFDSSYDRGTPATFLLSQVITGWQIGIPKIKPGGKIKLILPSEYGYASQPPSGSGIPKNAVLVFSVELIDVL